MTQRTHQMWIEIKDDIFYKCDFDSLNYLLNIITWYPTDSVRRYDLLIPNIDNIILSDNFKKLSNPHKALIQDYAAVFNDWIVSSSSTSVPDYIITYVKADRCFSPEESIRILSEPISIILENNKNDSYFIRSVIYHFESFDKKLIHFLENGWIKFENAGGCSNVTNLINGFLIGYENLASKYGKNTIDYFKGFVIWDSDKEYFGQPQHTKFTKPIKELHSLKIGYHILSKRAMENYMPIEVYDEISVTHMKSKNISSWISTFKHLDDEKKDYLDIAKGFERDKKNVVKKLSGEIEKFYSLNETQLQHLGIGLQLKDFKNEFPKLFFTSPQVNKKTLNARDGKGELLEIFNKIKKLI